MRPDMVIKTCESRDRLDDTSGLQDSPAPASILWHGRIPWIAIFLGFAGFASTWLACSRPDENADIPVDLFRGDDASVAVVTQDSEQRENQLSAALDPKNDGWETEAIAEQAAGQLAKIVQFLEDPTDNHANGLSSLAHDDFVSGPLWPSDVESVFGNGTFEVRHEVVKAGSPTDASGPEHQGASAFAQALMEAPLIQSAATGVHAKFKIFRVEAAANEILTEAFFEGSGLTTDGAFQQNATWICRWTTPSGNAPMKLVSVTVKDYEEVQYTQGTPGALLADCTESVFVNEPCFSEQLAQNIYHWAGRIERHLGPDNRAFQGLAIGDVNGDGLDDIYLCQPGGLPNRLLVQNADGTVSDTAFRAGVDWYDSTTSALLVDVDNDGDQDLVIASRSGLLFMSNDGTGNFRIQARQPGGSSDTVSAADFDLDGDLDFYVARYSKPDGTGNLPLPYHDANNGPANVCYRNEGNWKFTNVTAEVGFNQYNERFSWTAAWEDLDNDGDPDLYVANDFGRNNFYRNDNGQFTDVAEAAGVEDRNTGMATAFADYNRDGRMDVYVSNMWSSAGNRITYQRQFKSRADEQTKDQFRYLARGNSLFDNRGDGTFRDVSVDAGVTMGRWSWASLFCDLDNDGWQDLLVANGMITGNRPGDL